MPTFSKKQIKELAFNRGADMSWVDFIVSLEMAQKMAADVLQYLKANGIKNPPIELVVAKESRRWPGVFAVTVHWPGVSRSSLSRGGAELNKLDTDLACAALESALKPEYLVTSYTSRMPKK